MDIRENWINLIHRAATGTKRTRTLLTPIGIVIFGVFTALFALVGTKENMVLVIRHKKPGSI